MGTATAGTLTPAFERERPMLLAHAYRMLGSLPEAEDAVQDTYLRAMRGWASFENRSSVRTWLYRIATNACLNALDGRRPAVVGPYVSPIDPADAVTSRESVRLAFVAGLQVLPPRQRAVLLLREVLAFSAAETGEILDLSVAAVKSALQRARARIDAAAPRRDEVLEPDDPRARELLERYMAAWESADPAAFRELLRADASIGPAVGLEACLEYAVPSMGAPGDWRMEPIVANDQPAVRVWWHGEPYGIAVLTPTASGILAIDLFPGG